MDCPNCKKSVEASRYDLHYATCIRNTIKCPRCHSAIRKDLLEEHTESVHIKHPCEDCGVLLYDVDLDNHRESDCEKRHVNCKFCDLTVFACQLDEHTSSCGARMDTCPKCDQMMTVATLNNHEPQCDLSMRICELCEQQFPAKNILVHQAECKKNQRNPLASIQPRNESASWRHISHVSTTPTPSDSRICPECLQPINCHMENVRCSRCKELVSKHLYKTEHSQNCCRCSTCNEMFRNTRYLTGHVNLFRRCPLCGESVLRCAIESGVHQCQSSNQEPLNHASLSEANASGGDTNVNVCQSLPAPCSYCSKLCSLFQLDEHENHCKARTEACPDCGAFVQRQNWSQHPCFNSVSGNGLPEPQEPNTDNEDLAFLHRAPSSMSSVMIPCEFCGELLPADSMMFHQPNCMMNSRASTPFLGNLGDRGLNMDFPIADFSTATRMADTAAFDDHRQTMPPVLPAAAAFNASQSSTYAQPSHKPSQISDQQYISTSNSASVRSCQPVSGPPSPKMMTSIPVGNAPNSPAETVAKNNLFPTQAANTDSAQVSSYGQSAETTSKNNSNLHSNPKKPLSNPNINRAPQSSSFAKRTPSSARSGMPQSGLPFNSSFTTNKPRPSVNSAASSRSDAHQSFNRPFPLNNPSRFPSPRQPLTKPVFAQQQAGGLDLRAPRNSGPRIAGFSSNQSNSSAGATVTKNLSYQDSVNSFGKPSFSNPGRSGKSLNRRTVPRVQCSPGNSSSVQSNQSGVGRSTLKGPSAVISTRQPKSTRGPTQFGRGRH